MDWNYYKSGPRDSLNPAYQMGMQGQLAQSEAMGGLFDKLVSAMQENRRIKLMQDQEARLKEQSSMQLAADADRLKLGRDELSLRREQTMTQMAQDAALAEGMANLAGGQQQSPSPQMGGTPFQAPNITAPRLSAQSILGGGNTQMDPQLIRRMGGDNASRYMNQANTLRDDETRRRDYEEKRQAHQEQVRSYDETLRRAVKEGALTESQARAYRDRGIEGAASLAEAIGKAESSAREEGEWKATRSLTFKELRKEFANDPKKLGEIDGLEKGFAISGDGHEGRMKALREASLKLRGVNEKAERDYGVDLPGIGQNITLNTTIDRRKDGGGAYAVKDGEVVGLSEAEKGELNRLVDTATSKDRLFDDSLMMVIAGDKLPPEYQKNLDAARDVQRAKIRKDILNQFGWEEVDARWADGGSAAPSAAQPGLSNDPGENIATEMLQAVSSGKIGNDAASMQKYLEANYTPDALRKVMERSEAAAGTQREAAIRKALAEGPGHKKPVKQMPSVGGPPPSWGKDQ